MGRATDIKYIENNDVEPIFLNLTAAVYNSSYQEVDKGLDKNPDFINKVVTPTNQSLLSSLLSKKTIDYVMLNTLVKHGVSFNYPINTSDDLPVDYACKIRNMTLLAYLVQHGAPIRESAAHKLLNKAKNIGTVNFEEIILLHHLIKQLGGMSKVADIKDAQGQTFKNKAMKVSLVNEFSGILRYNLWNLLSLAEVIDLHKDSRKDEYQAETETLRNEIALINAQYHDKANSDSSSLGSSLFVMFNTGSSPIGAVDEADCKHQKTHTC